MYCLNQQESPASPQKGIEAAESFQNGLKVEV